MAEPTRNADTVIAVPALMEAASRQTGLTDFGDPRLMAPLTALVGSFQQDAWKRMRESGKATAIKSLTHYLANRLRIIADRKHYPAIQHVRLKSPFIVIGPPRSGTTLLQTLLSQDPANIGPPHWLCLEPSPPPGLGAPSPARLAAASTRQREFFDQIPDMYVQHAYLAEEGASAIGECGSDILVMAMTTKAFWYYYPLDSYKEYLLSADHSGAMEFHHMFLQHASWGREHLRWALKAADHLVWLRDLYAAYPDANFLWTHRDLRQLFGSIGSVLCTCRGISGQVPQAERQSMARQAIELERRIFTNSMAARAAADESRFFDVSYHDLVANPLGTVQRIYQRFGLELSPEAAANIEEWIARNPRTKHGVHNYDTTSLEIEADTINRQFAAYRERFGFGFGITPPPASDLSA